MLLTSAYGMFRVSTNGYTECLYIGTSTTSHRRGTFGTPEATASRRQVREVHRCRCQRTVPAERVPSPQHRNAGCAGGLSRSAKVNTLRPSWESGAKWNDAVSGVFRSADAVAAATALLVSDSSLPESSVKVTRTLMTSPLSDDWSV